MKHAFLWNKQIFKQAIFGLAIIVVITAMFVFIQLIDQVKKDEEASLKFRVSVFEQLMKSNETDASFLLHDIIGEISYPVIITGPDSVPQGWINLNFHSEDTLAEVAEFLTEFQDYANPIPMVYDSLVLGYYFYGEPPFLKSLKRLPIIVLILISLLIAIAYFGLRKIRMSEKQSIWFGMAKEAAHQLGTPTSSLSGWVELMKNNEFQQAYVDEMENDIARIQTVINRFSLIGSQPKLVKHELNDIIHEVVTYYRARQPQFSTNAELKFIADDDIEINSNRELIIWVLENLIKNSLDAIINKQGLIEIRTVIGKSAVIIWCSDNGQGMETTVRKKIFEPGFSTKRRGWGIGLSLSKRIIEEFHFGRLEVESSKVDVGTTFRIELPR